MKAYCVVYEVVNDQDMFDEYRRQVPPTIEKHGGRFLARGGAFTVLEGDMPYERVVVLEFPSREAAETWYHSPEYQRLQPMRAQSTNSQFILVDGVDTGP